MKPTTRRRLRLLACVYLVKTVLVGTAWLVAPELSGRALSRVRQAWADLAATR